MTEHAVDADVDATIDRPEPVRSAGNIAAAVNGVATGLATVAVVLGYVTQTNASDLTSAVAGVVGSIVTLVTILAPILKARQARDLVTPLTDPRTVDGVALSPVALPPAVLPTAVGEHQPRDAGAIDPLSAVLILLVIVVIVVLLV